MDRTTSALDGKLFKSVYDRYFRKVFRFALRHTKNSQEAEDLTHDVFLKFWQYRAGFSLRIPVDAQLLVIAKQVLVNRYRREILKQESSRHLETERITRYDESEMLLREAELTEQLKLALECLPPKRKEIFEKSRFQVMTYDEIARDMGISSATVESQMVKALKFLRERLAHFIHLAL